MLSCQLWVDEDNLSPRHLDKYKYRLISLKYIVKFIIANIFSEVEGKYLAILPLSPVNTK